jgi:hypothetical protein
MKNASLILVFACALAALASGCSDTCTSTCERQNDCAGRFHQECDAVCNASESEAAHVNCAAQYSSLQSCIANPPAPTTVCDDDSATRCSHDQALYTECKNAYCAMHTDEPACRTP